VSAGLGDVYKRQVKGYPLFDGLSRRRPSFRGKNEFLDLLQKRNGGASPSL